VWVRHPSYTGIVLLMAGVLIHRIFVEEAVLTEVTGRAYADYAARTKRLVPGLW
jgi:protein-S-isoprenylcysteine O-methyltransferase Ste14